MNKYNVKLGDTFYANEGSECTVIDLLNKTECTIEFLDTFKYRYTVKFINLINGAIKNPYHPSVYNIGYVGVGKYKISENRKHTKAYKTWNHILGRCYNKTNKDYKWYGGKNVKICDEWLCFQNFAKWFYENYPNIENIKFNLDKDLLQKNVENKIYSPETCVFLPQGVNGFLANVQQTNTSGAIGVRLCSKTTYISTINDFNLKKVKTIGCYKDFEDAKNSYIIERENQASVVREYLKSLNYLNDDIINLIG